jgi:hypothetical protein
VYILGWLGKPGQALVSTINADLINRQSPEMQAFIGWLRGVFTEENTFF